MQCVLNPSPNTLNFLFYFLDWGGDDCTLLWAWVHATHGLLCQCEQHPVIYVYMNRASSYNIAGFLWIHLRAVSLVLLVYLVCLTGPSPVLYLQLTCAVLEMESLLNVCSSLLENQTPDTSQLLGIRGDLYTSLILYTCMCVVRESFKACSH